MSLEYLLLFGLGLAVAAALATMGSEIATFVVKQIEALIT